jgi:hypothetical protein
MLTWLIIALAFVPILILVRSLEWLYVVIVDWLERNLP